ncbi:hypothetical protein THII_2266 [Thioploca ingrica]|uniref:Uncharacterized protein n=1 Tax=Thioploca ingrica TaxID=40754 RepID=A0A090AEV4_9GAMM|nr:hypothetical protein THII_2266 [Thioploca ingrica]
MLLSLLSQYLEEVEAIINKLREVYVESYEEEVLAPDRINLQIRIRFLTGYLLELNEAVVVESAQLKYLSYRYHFQDKQNHLIFRYDNAPHFPNLDSFPHHKHLKNKVIATHKPSIDEVVQEVDRFITN